MEPRPSWGVKLIEGEGEGANLGAYALEVGWRSREIGVRQGRQHTQQLSLL